MHFILKYFHYLSKIASRKNLYNFIRQEIEKEISKKQNKKFKVLNIGSGGDVETLLKNIKNVELVNVDIDPKRRPDKILDITETNFEDKINFKPDLITIFEVLEHVKSPEKAINNIYKILPKDSCCLASVPFIFHIHDEPNDFYRFTEYGLKNLFMNFSDLKIKARNGWLETIFVILIRFIKEKSILMKLLGLLFIILYFLFYPIIQLIQYFFKTKKITTGYLLKDTK